MGKSIKLSVFAILLSPVFAPAAFAACSVNDFLVGAYPGGIPASGCFEGYTKPKAVQGAIETELGGDWTQFGKYNNGDGLVGEEGSLVVEVTESYDTGFDWELTDPSELNGFQDAVFVVKQANPNSPNNVDGVAWVAYLVENITDTMGTFFTETNFTVDDYSFLAAFGSGERVHSVPEIDGASAGIVFSLLLSLIAIIRERRIRR